MSKHWYDRQKGAGVKKFSKALERKISPEHDIKPPQTPQPQLTPKGPARTAVDVGVREQMAASRARVKEAILRKLKKDREQENKRTR